SSTIGKDSVVVKPENDSKDKTNLTNIVTDLSERNNQLIHTKKKQSDLLAYQDTDKLINLNSTNDRENTSSKLDLPTEVPSKSISKSVDTDENVKETASKSEVQSENANEENKNKLSKVVIVFVSFIVLTGGIVYLVYNKKTRKVIIVLLATSTALAQTGILTVKAVENEKKSFNSYKEVSIENIKHKIGFKIEYDKPKEQPEGELDSAIIIQVNESTNDEVIEVRTVKTSLSGLVNSNDNIDKVIATYYSNVDEKVKNIKVTGLSNWSINDIPLEIGTNFITLTAYTKTGSFNQKEVLINRLSTTLELADNVVPVDPKTEQGLKKIESISSNILEYWTSDNGTPEDTSDDMLNLLVKNESPILKDITSNTIKVGDILYIPANEYFFSGLSLLYESHDDEDNAYGYNPEDTEVIHMYQATLSDLIEGEISISADSIDYSDPVDYIIAPENAVVKIGNDSMVIPSEDANSRSVLSKNSHSEDSLSSVFNPQFALDENDNGNLNISMKIEDFILADEDGDEETKKDQVSYSGELSYSNYNVDFNVERKLFIGLPDQVKSGTSHVYSKNHTLKLPEISLDNDDYMKEIAKKYSLNPKQIKFGNFSSMGLDMDNTIVLGAIGLNLITGVVTTQDGVFNSILDANAVALFLLDINGEMKVSISLQENENSYIEKGVNVQKDGFVGSHGTVKENKGTKNSQQGEYWVQTSNIEAKSSAEKDQPPSLEKIISIDGEGEIGVKVSAGLGVTVSGTLPIALRAGIDTRIKGEYQGKLSLSHMNVDHTGTGSLEMGIYAEERFDIALGVKATIGPFEQKLWSKTILSSEESGNFEGTIYTKDFDQDISNNQTLSGAKLTLEAYDNFAKPRYEVVTNEQGEFIFENLPIGKYKLTIQHANHKQYVIEEFDFKNNVVEDYYLDKESNPIKLEGRITIADADLNNENNVPLTNVDVSLQKKFPSDNKNITVKTNENGQYLFSNLTPGVYEIKMNKEGFLETKSMVVVGLTETTEVSNHIMEAISINDAGTGTISGKLIDTFTGGQALGDFRLAFHEGYNYKNAETIKEITTVSGKYAVDLPAGIYTVYVTPLSSNEINYQADTFFVKVLGNKTIEEQNGKVTPVLEKDQIRVVLTWGETPNDLDSHLTAELDSQEQFQISYRDKNKKINENAYYKLDVDDTNQFGPETTTLSSPVGGKYTFSVFNYTNNTNQELKNSGAMVKVYFSEQITPFVFYVPNLDGNAWDVFEYNITEDTFKVLNKVYVTSSREVGPIVNYQNARTLLNQSEDIKGNKENEEKTDEIKSENISE
ncbi:MAG: carboxypeptidase regulatory-like domain-containing protein, partial [Carnobacterium sp.]|nr:carboxypeptidase regulatory-like domain-containing protein [Carnobacterium sp.]